MRAGGAPMVSRWMQLSTALATAALVCDCFEAYAPENACVDTSNSPNPPNPPSSPSCDSWRPSPPADLRGFGSVAVAVGTFAPIVDGYVAGVLQIALVCALAVAAAELGAHEATPSTRASQALYVAFTSLIAIAPAAIRGVSNLLRAYAKKNATEEEEEAVVVETDAWWMRAPLPPPESLAFSDHNPYGPRPRAPSALLRGEALIATEEGGREPSGEALDPLAGEALQIAMPAFSLLVYVGACIVRSGLSACDAARSYAAPLRGCLACDGASSAATAATGGACLAAATAALWCTLCRRPVEAQAVATVGGSVCALTLLCQLFAEANLLSTNLLVFPSDGGTAGCVDATTQAEVAERCLDDSFAAARRHDVVARSLAPSIFAAAALAAAAAGLREGRRRTLAQRKVPEEVRALVPEAWAVAFVCVAALAFHLSTMRWSRTTWTDAAFSVLFVGVGIAAAFDELVGAAVIYGGIALDASELLSEAPETFFDYYTFVSWSVTTLGLLVCIASASFGMLAGRCARAAHAARVAAAACCTAARGAAIGLAVMTTALIALYDGRDLHSLIVWHSPTSAGHEEGETGGEHDALDSGTLSAAYRRTLARLIVWHYGPALAWTGLHTRLLDDRKGGYVLAPRWRWTAWIAGYVLTFAVWLAAIAARGDRPVFPPEYPMSYVFSMVIAGVAVVLPVYLLAC